MGLEGKSLITTQDWKKNELEYLLEKATKLKQMPKDDSLRKKTLFMVFFNSSLRTRSSFETAMIQSGGSAVNLSVGKDTWSLEHEYGVEMDGDKSEHVQDAAKVLSRYGDILSVRSFPQMQDWKEERKDKTINGFAEHSTVPLINMESSLYHPCQGLADVMTMREHLGDLQGKKFVLAWCYHPKPLPTAVPNSSALIASRFGMDVKIACPERYKLDPEIVDKIKNNCKDMDNEFSFVNDLDEGVKDTDIVYAKSWGSLNYYGRWQKETEIRKKHKDWKISPEKMKSTNNGKFMHCLPVRRNVVADDEVLDSESSIVFDEAENRLHAQKALLDCIVGGEDDG